MEQVSGHPSEVGAVTHLTYREAGRDVRMVETVIERVPPTVLVCTLSSAMMTSTLGNRFASTADGHTRWVVDCEIDFRGPWKLLGIFGKRMIVRKTVEDMERFKRLLA